jgi:hypothetical protein
MINSLWKVASEFHALESKQIPSCYCCSLQVSQLCNFLTPQMLMHVPATVK